MKACVFGICFKFGPSVPCTVGGHRNYSIPTPQGNIYENT